ncbi:CRISPR-associated protein Cas4 [Anaerohalosphaera lusitana]|uniref:CRISPR-associated exonuclease Cas4 n=1 Tax=Anaerohalosphaera lusitana TaxID=1936003 RepID=A0A1U9NLK7_9BACT|nr:CRISPR-associated protein Cas4 [Anaerohalosphaera lusitana]AQT68715.1 CRISPR-associated protein Cas4 [Anaerohalosphaera lusitana]
MYSEDELISISALQHYAFCPRQCGLIHIEQTWLENMFTAKGRVLHEKVHESDNEVRSDLRIVRGLRIRSLRIGLVGQSDVVEFLRSETGIVLPGTEGLWQPFPVEYKRGKPKTDSSDSIQLCAQAMCLEEMLNVSIEKAAVFYGRPRKRFEVDVTDELREETVTVLKAIRTMLTTGQTPKAKYSRKCKSCSLYARCMPRTTGISKRIGAYISKAYEDPEEVPD